MSIDWKKILGLKNGEETKVQNPKSKKAKEKGNISPEILKNLPPGTKIKQISIGPQDLLRVAMYVLIALWLWSIVRQLSGVGGEVSRVPISEIVTQIKKGETSEVVVTDNEVSVKIKDTKKTLTAAKEPSISMTEILQKEGVDIGKVVIRVENREGWKILGDILILVLTVGLPLVFILWLFRKSGAGGMGGMFGFGKSTAKLFVKGKQKITFKDVAGVDEAKKDLAEVVDFLKHPEKYIKMGARAPKGVLLVGPSGVGKTLLAKAVAGEANVPFFSMAGSEFMEMLVGVGASRARDLFATAKKAGKAIIFIDEIDAIGRMRGGLDGGHGEREQTLNQILVEMDGFEANDAVVVLAATNRGDLLDPALLRPGRFDRRVVLEMPDLEARVATLKIHAKGKPFIKSVDWEAVARRTVGFSGADLENMLNEAAIGAARANKTSIGMEEIEESALKVKMGSEKRRAQTDEDRRMTAYHEAGHAVVNNMSGLDPVHRVSIVSRGMALGFTLIPPSRDRVHETKSRLEKQMMMALGGRAAEELIFDDITTGAASDISYVTRIARGMVEDWGMSKLGPMNYGPMMDISDWGKAIVEPSKLSDEMQSVIDTEVNKLINEALVGAKKILKENRDKLDRVAILLIEKESIDGPELEKAMRG